MTTIEDTKPFDPATFEPDGRTVADVLRDVNRYVVDAGLEFGEYDFSNMVRYDRVYAKTDVPLQHNDAGDAIWPEKYRWVICSPVKGGSEGYYIHLATVEARDGAMLPDYRMLGLAKTWTWESALAIANAVSTLFQKNQPYARYILVAPKPA